MAPGSDGLVPVRRALLSVSDTTGLSAFAGSLTAHSVELLATSGTRAALEKAGVACRAAEEITGIGAWFGGRIKTLHPALLGGILAPRTAEGEAELAQRGIAPIDLVVVNFYPFGHHLAEHPAATDLEEYVDIGGVTLARAAAKNHRYVAAVTDPGEYDDVASELTHHSGRLSAATRRRLAAAAFDRTSEYDRLIGSTLAGRKALVDSRRRD